MDYEGGVPEAGDNPAPSWGRRDWPPLPTDALTLALDAGGIGLAKPAKTNAKAASIAAPAPVVADATAVERAAQDSISAMMLIRTYRVRGHLAANLDPLGLTKRELPADLTPEYHGFQEADLDRAIFLGGALGMVRSAASSRSGSRAVTRKFSSRRSARRRSSTS